MTSGIRRCPQCVLEDQRGARRAGEVLVAPPQQGQDDRVELPAGGGEVVLEALRVVAVPATLQDAGVDQRAEPGGQRVPRRSGAPDHLVEAAVAQEDLADGQQCPLLADHLERAGDGADAGLRRCGHVASLPRSVRYLDGLTPAGYRASRIRTHPGGRPWGLASGRLHPRRRTRAERSDGGDRGGAGHRGVHVQPRPVHRQPGVPLDRGGVRGGGAGLAVVDPQRVHDRVRGGADPGRTVGRPGGAPARAGRGPGRVHRRIAALRPGPGGGLAGGGADGAGGRRGRDGAGVVVAAAGRRPAGAAGPGARDPGRRSARWARPWGR